MFGFLKNLGKPPQAELVAYEDGVIHFRCDSQLAPQKRVNLHCRLPEGEEFGAVVEVMSVQPTSEKRTAEQLSGSAAIAGTVPRARTAAADAMVRRWKLNFVMLVLPFF